MVELNNFRWLAISRSLLVVREQQTKGTYYRVPSDAVLPEFRVQPQFWHFNNRWQFSRRMFCDVTYTKQWEERKENLFGATETTFGFGFKEVNPPNTDAKATDFESRGYPTNTYLGSPILYVMWHAASLTNTISSHHRSKLWPGSGGWGLNEADSRIWRTSRMKRPDPRKLFEY